MGKRIEGDETGGLERGSHVGGGFYRVKVAFATETMSFKVQSSKFSLEFCVRCDVTKGSFD